jgi:hypothetical protein
VEVKVEKQQHGQTTVGKRAGRLWLGCDWLQVRVGPQNSFNELDECDGTQDWNNSPLLLYIIGLGMARTLIQQYNGGGFEKEEFKGDDTGPAHDSSSGLID